MLEAKKLNTDSILIQEALNVSYLKQPRYEKPFTNKFPEHKKLAVVVKFPEQNLVATYTARMNVLRFFAICSIVWGHSLGAFENMTFTNSFSHAVQTAMIELGKIGTVIFFTISGFFLADKIHKYNVVTYLRYRLFTLIIPWLCFLVLFVIIQIMHILSFRQLTLQSSLTTFVLFISLFKAFIFHAAYWFIPVAILSASLLVAFKHQLNKTWFIALLLAITMFYSINLYHGWISANHTKAFLAYVFFMWLGVQVKYRIYKIRNFTQSIPWSVLLPVLATLFSAACLEGTHLKHIASSDPYASIRLSNWLLSTGIFLAFLKTNRMAWVNHLKPQCYVYGVYLIHCIIITELTPFINQLLIQKNLSQFLPQLMFLYGSLFTLVMALSYLTAIAVKQSPIGYIMGSIKH